MALFIAIIINNSKNMFFRAFKPCFTCIYITFTSENTKVRVFPFLFFLSKPFLRFFSNLLKDFRISRRIFCIFRLLGLKLDFFDSKVLYYNIWSPYLSCNDVSYVIILLNLTIYLSNIRNRLEAFFNLSLDRLFNYHFWSIRLPTYQVVGYTTLEHPW